MEVSASLGNDDSESKKDEPSTSTSKTDEKNVLDKEHELKTSDEKNGLETEEDQNAPDLQTADVVNSDLVKDDQEKLKMKTEPDTDYPDEDIGDDAHGNTFEDSPLSRSVDFMFETKYVMLNFMSLIPPEIYRGHISTSPDTEPDLSHGFAKRRSNLSKSKSFDISSYNRKPHLKHIGKLKTMQKRMDSPASEDNLSYRYKKNWIPIDSPSCERFNSDPGTPPAVSELFEKSHSTHEFSTHSSPSMSPQKPFHSPQRLFSDASSSGELSYMSDADDEYEEHSNASSIFSARSISSRDGFLDLRRPFRGVHVLPTLQSQSEDKDEADALFPQHNDYTENNADGGDLETLPEEIKDDSAFEIEKDKESMEYVPQGIAEASGRSRLRQTADRSKLKLNIPCETVQLDDILLSLHSELSSELDEMESEFEEALQSARSRLTRSSGNITPITPQTEAARILARIGDDVKEQYGAQLAAAVNQLTYEQINNLSYSQFRNIAQSVVTAEVPGWRQVALLMVFGQKIIWGAVQHGQRHVGNVVDYCAQFVAENAAEFIIKQGGWGSVMNFDPSSDAQSSAEFDTSPEMVVDYFTSHDVTQVESQKCIDDDESGEAANDQSGYQDDQTAIDDDDSQIFEDESVIRPGQGLTVPHHDKPRYASSVGFEYTDVIEDMTGEEIRSDSETDINIAFVQTEEVEAKFEGMEKRKVKGIEERKFEENDDDAFKPEEGAGNVGGFEVNEQGKEELVEETIDGKILIDNNDMKTTNDLISEKVTDDKKVVGYNRDAVYVRQDTPNSTMFDNVVGDLNVDKDMNGNKTDKESENGIHSRDNHYDNQDISCKGKGMVDKSDVKVDTITEDSNNEIVEDESKGILHLKSDADIETLDGNSSKDISVGKLLNKGNTTANTEYSSGEISGTNTQTDIEGGEQLIKDNDLINSDEMNKNNNRQASGKDCLVEDMSPDSYQDYLYDDYESDSESTQNESFEREVTDDYQSSDIDEINEAEISEMEIVQESYALETVKSIGLKVAVLAVALMAVGLSVRLATLSR